MAVSLEQVRLVMGEHEVERDTSCRLLDTLRSDGLQREKCGKYRVTPHQIRHLPPQYRPPLGSYGSGNV